MKHSVYWELMNDEFGSIRAASLHSDLTLSTLGSRTAEEAFSDGFEPKEIWRAVCEATGVPEERFWGIEKNAKKGSAPF